MRARKATRRWLVHGVCRITGHWRQIVWAVSADAAVRAYCAEHGMDAACCWAEPD